MTSGGGRGDINSWPPGERPRERLLEKGAEQLSDAELLAVLLGTGDGRAGYNALDTGREMLIRFGGLRGLLRAGQREFEELPGVGPVKVARILAALELGGRATAAPAGERVELSCSRDVYRAYRSRLSPLTREVFLAVLLDVRKRRIRDVRVSEGGLTGTLVYPRDVLGPAIREAAAGLIVLHNHPSGDPTPSPEDLEVTHRLAAAGELVGIPLLDHLIIGHDGYVSLADQGFLGRHQELKGAGRDRRRGDRGEEGRGRPLGRQLPLVP